MTWVKNADMKCDSKMTKKENAGMETAGKNG